MDDQRTTGEGRPCFLHAADPGSGLDRVDGAGMHLVVRRLGAEVIGLAVDHPRHGRVGLLWRDGQADDPPRWWKGHATVLFPIVGGVNGHRSRTTGGDEVRFRGLHGFARHSAFGLVRAAPDGDGFELAYALEPDAGIAADYPWPFRLEVAYRLSPGRLEATFTVRNRGERTMPFQVGWHPGFAAPFVAGAKADCHLRLPPGPLRRRGNDGDCRLTGASWIEESAGDYPYDETGLDRTYMLDLADVPPDRRVVTLADPDGSIGVRVRFPDFPHLGLWSDAGAPFLCIEPWQGMDDHAVQEPFDRKLGVVLLPPGGRDVRRASIEVDGLPRPGEPGDPT